MNRTITQKAMETINTAKSSMLIKMLKRLIQESIIKKDEENKTHWCC